MLRLALVLLLSLIGCTFWLSGRGALNTSDATALTRLVTELVLPAVIFASVSRHPLPQSLAGRLGGKEIVVALTNISIVNSAMTTQLMLDHFQIEQLVFSGVAEGVSPEAPLGTVTIPERWGFHQESYFHREGSSTPCTYFIGIQLAEQVNPGEEEACAGAFAPARNLFSPFGFVFLRKTAVVAENDPQYLPDGTVRAVTAPGQAFNPDTDQELKFWFDVDPGTFEAAQEVARQASSGELDLLECRPEDLQSDGSCGGEVLSPAPRVVVGQNGVSGPAFVDNAEYRRWVYDTLTYDDGADDGSAVDRVLGLDMETAASHMVSYANGTPFLAVRSVSDLAGAQSDLEQFGVFFSVAAENSSRVVRRLLELLPEGGASARR